MDNLTPEQRKKNMRKIRSHGSLPERIIEKELKKRKIYFAKQVKTIIGKPDIVFRRKKVIVFIDSDFWHKHPKRFTQPKTNVEYWTDKINSNVERDKIVNSELLKSGWTVIRLWEFDIINKTDICINKILKAIGRIDFSC